MKILLIDNDPNSNQIFEHMTRIKNYDIVRSNYSFSEYINDKFDLVIVDFDDKKSLALLKKILIENSKQNIITISEKLECAGLVSCKDCVELYNKKRLIKPLDFRQLLQTIEKFDSLSCKYQNIDCFDDFYLIVDDFMRKFSYYIYDESDNTIYANEKANENVLTMELLYLTKLLNNFDVSYELVSSKEIKLK